MIRHDTIRYDESCVMRYGAMPFCVIWHDAILFCVKIYNKIQCDTILCDSIWRETILCCTILFYDNWDTTRYHMTMFPEKKYPLTLNGFLRSPRYQPFLIKKMLAFSLSHIKHSHAEFETCFMSIICSCQTWQCYWVSLSALFVICFATIDKVRVYLVWQVNS